jgi:tetratricopeptide (TPR) repeat protein
MTRLAPMLLALIVAGAASAAEPAEVTRGMQKALEAFSKGDFKEARDRFAQLAGAYPGNTLFQLNLGTAEYRLKNYGAAEVALKRAIAIDIENAPAWMTLGILYLEQQKPEAALAALSQAALLDPGSARAHAYLGLAAGQRGWLLGAEKELRQAIQLQPDYADAHFNLALFYLQRTPPAVELARRHYQEALHLGATPDPLVEAQLEEPGVAAEKTTSTPGGSD